MQDNTSDMGDVDGSWTGSNNERHPQNKQLGYCRETPWALGRSRSAM